MKKTKNLFKKLLILEVSFFQEKRQSEIYFWSFRDLALFTGMPQVIEINRYMNSNFRKCDYLKLSLESYSSDFDDCCNYPVRYST